MGLRTFNMILFSIAHICVMMPSRFLFSQLMFITVPTAHVPTCDYNSQHSPWTQWEPLIPDKIRFRNYQPSSHSEDLSTHPFLHPSVSPLFCLAIKWHYCCISKAAECSHSIKEWKIRPLSITRPTGNEIVSCWMWSMPILHWWAQRGAVALPFPRCWSMMMSENWAHSKQSGSEKREKGAFNSTTDNKHRRQVNLELVRVENVNFKCCYHFAEYHLNTHPHVFTLALSKKCGSCSNTFSNQFLFFIQFVPSSLLR